MITVPKGSDAQHKTWLLRTLDALYQSPLIAKRLYFKGGTCAAMQDFISRFSVDLDFDYAGTREEMQEVKNEVERIVVKLGLTISNASKHVPQYFLKYPAEGQSSRNTLKIDAAFPPSPSNIYESVLLPEIDRVITCQTRETMFANKLVALINRQERGGKVAGRDVFDIHAFFLRGFTYVPDIIIEQRPTTSLIDFFISLEQFVEKQVTQGVIDNDLNTLLPYEEFNRIRLHLKREVRNFLRDEIKRLEHTSKQ